MAASSISNTQFSSVSSISSISSIETAGPVETGEPAPNEPARPQLGAAAQELTAPPSDSGRGRNVDVVA
jgi:hypothetical protein